MTRLLFALLFCSWIFVCVNFIHPENTAIAVWFLGAGAIITAYIQSELEEK